MRGKLVGLLLVWATVSQGQQLTLNGGFVQDSLKIGEPVEYWLTARYPADMDLVLPDSNFNFSPFEFAARKYFETLADTTIAQDSVVYSLQSFEIDKVQYLNLPAIVLLDEDSALLTSPLDSIFLVELVAQASDTTALMTNTDYQDVPSEFNSPLMMIILGVLGAIALIVLLAFGKKIKRHFKLKRMAKSHEQFLSQIGEYIHKLKETGTPEVAEEAINIWRKYLEKLEKIPFTKLTSKEIVEMELADELREPLKAVDRCVYGKISSDSLYQDFQHLEDFAQNRYDYQVNKLKEDK